MGRQNAVILGAVVMAALAGCGSSSAVAGGGSGGAATRTPARPVPAVPLSDPIPPVVHAASADVLAVAAYSLDARATTVRVTLVRGDGFVLATAHVPIDAQWSVSSGRGGAFWVAAGRLQRLGVDGRVTDLGPLMAGQQGRVAVAPDGASWVYATMVTAKDGRIDNRLWRASAGAGSTLIAERVSDPAAPTANAPSSWQYAVKSWTESGVLVVREPTGGCGCGAFDMEMMSGNSALVDPLTGVAHTLGVDSSCPLSNSGPGGLAVCFHAAAVAAADGTTGDDELRLLRGTTVQAYRLSGTTIGGDARIDASGATLAYATAPGGSDCGDWQMNTTLRVLDLATGDARAVGPRGLQPSAWLVDGRLAATQARAGATPADATTSVVTVDTHSGVVTTVLAGGSLRVVGIAT